MADYTVDKIKYNSNTYVFQDNTSGYYTKSAIVDMFYPVGTIYQTVDSTFSPQTSWGGTWVLLQGAFLVGATNINDSTVYNHTSTTVAANADYTIPITLDLVTGDTFSILLSTGVRCVYTFNITSSVNNMVYSGGASISNNTGSSVTIVECAKGFGSSSTSVTTAVGGEAVVKLKDVESGIRTHAHTNGNLVATASSTTTTGSGGAWGFRSAALLPRTGSTGLVGTESNVTLSKSSTQRYSISNNNYTTAKTTSTIDDTVSHAGHTHSLNSHTHPISGTTGTIEGTDASYSHNNIPPYIPVYTWKRTA